VSVLFAIGWALLVGVCTYSKTARRVDIGAISSGVPSRFERKAFVCLSHESPSLVCIVGGCRMARQLHNNRAWGVRWWGTAVADVGAQGECHDFVGFAKARDR